MKVNMEAKGEERLAAAQASEGGTGLEVLGARSRPHCVRNNVEAGEGKGGGGKGMGKGRGSYRKG